MRELLYVYSTSLGEREVFMRKLVPLTVGEVRFSRAIDRIEHIRYWKQQHDDLDAALASLQTAERGDADRAELLTIKDLQYRVSDLLAWVADTLMPQAGEAHAKGIDTAIDLLLRRAPSRMASTK